MDAEGLGRKLLLTPSGDPRRAPEKQIVGDSQNANPASTFELSQCQHCKGGLPGPRRGFWVPSSSLSPKRPRPFAHYREFLDCGFTKGKGTADVMKRWHFAGGPASHGSSKSHSQDTPNRILKQLKCLGNFPLEKKQYYEQNT